jgi:3-isopropylmalate/(R)-2-methylmalate dehydratase small subunit
MTGFRRLETIAVPIDAPNVDTDQIIPARYLLRSRREDYGALLFRDLRFSADGRERPDFPLNRPVWRKAGIIVGNANFGCGSAREQAVWALADFGIHALVAPSYGDIFYGNCIQNGILPVRLAADSVAALRATLARAPGSRIVVDLETECVTGPDGTVLPFAIDPAERSRLLTGADDIALTLGHEAAIGAFESQLSAERSWARPVQRGPHS